MYKSLIGFIAALALCVGCASNNDSKQVACDNAEKAYLAYQALIAAGAIDVDKDTIAKAKLAAAVLGMYCGWDMQLTTAKNGAKAVPVYDGNGVPVLTR